MAKAETLTQLSIPTPLYERIQAQAVSDRRTARPEMIILLEEAVEAREKRVPLRGVIGKRA